MRILVVEDDAVIAGLIRSGLTEAGYEVTLAGDGHTGLQLALRHAYHAIVLDWMLPGRDGVSVCRLLRETGDRTPVLMLTARDTVTDRVDSRTTGVDDYLPKPFDFRELLARLQALVRRDGSLDERTITVGDLEINVARGSAARGGVKLLLTDRERLLLHALAQNAGRPVPWETLQARIEAEEGGSLGEGSIQTLQAKLVEAGGEPMIHAVGTLGYQMG